MAGVSRDAWLLAEGVTFLNHGSFGLLPRSVREAQQTIRDQIAAEPVEFLSRRLPDAIDAVCTRLGNWLGAPPADLIPVDNATTGMNIAAASVALAPGDEVLVTDHEYGAVRRIWERACSQRGAKLITAEIPVPLASPEELVEVLAKAVTSKTKAAVLSQVTSPTALVFPVESWCKLLAQRGVITVVDGPHAVGMRPLNLSSLDCDFFVASCHKWLSAPIGSGFLYVHPRRQRDVRPVVVSWGRIQSAGPPTWRHEFFWLGTRDPSPFLSIPAAIDFFEAMGPDHFRRHGHALARLAREGLMEMVAAEPLSPAEEACFGTMVAVWLSHPNPDVVHQRLWQQHRIEVPVHDWQGRCLIRVSCHLYNEQADIDRLLGALASIMRS